MGWLEHDGGGSRGLEAGPFHYMRRRLFTAMTWAVLLLATMHTPMVWNVLWEPSVKEALLVQPSTPAVEAAPPQDEPSDGVCALGATEPLADEDPGPLALAAGLQYCQVWWGDAWLEETSDAFDPMLCWALASTRLFTLGACAVFHAAFLLLLYWLDWRQLDRARSPAVMAMLGIPVVAGLIVLGSTVAVLQGGSWLDQPVAVLTFLLVAIVPFAWGSTHRPTPIGRMVLDAGYAAVLLVGLELVGEALWLQARINDDLGGLITYRNYAIWTWGVTCGVLLCVAFATDRVAEVVRAEGYSLMWAWMPLVTVLVVDTVGGSLRGLDQHLPRRPLAEQTARIHTSYALGEARADMALWLRHTLARLDRGDPDHPVVIMAASGGGTRAAVWAYLTLEALASACVDGSAAVEGTCPPAAADNRGGSWLDQVLAVSTVSGGSLGSAMAFHAQPAPFGPDGARAQHPGWNNAWYDLVVANTRVALQTIPHVDDEALSLLAEVKHDRAFDRLMTHHTAPMLRGLHLPNYTRGGALWEFWRTRRLVNRHDQEHGMVVGEVDPSPPPAWHTRPHMWVNFTDAELGHRVVAGYPRLPTGLLGGRDYTTAVGDLDPFASLPLVDAVRASSAFPFGLDVVRVVDTAGRKWRWNDGGVLDNTGLDTVAKVMEGLARLAEPIGPTGGDLCPTDAAWTMGVTEWSCLAGPEVRRLAHDLKGALEHRGVLLLEVDAGARTTVSRSQVAEALDSDSALSVGSLYASMVVDDTRTRLQHLATATRTLTRRASDTPSADEGASARGRLDLALGGRVNVHHVRIGYRPDPADEVMTAWGLGAGDLGRLFAQVAVEKRRVLPRLASISHELATGAALGLAVERATQDGDPCGLELLMHGVTAVTRQAAGSPYRLAFRSSREDRCPPDPCDPAVAEPTVPAPGYPLHDVPPGAGFTRTWVPGAIEQIEPARGAPAPPARAPREALIWPWAARAWAGEGAGDFELAPGAPAVTAEAMIDLRAPLPGWDARPGLPPALTRIAVSTPDHVVLPATSDGTWDLHAVDAEALTCSARDGTTVRVTWVQVEPRLRGGRPGPCDAPASTAEGNGPAGDQSAVGAAPERAAAQRALLCHHACRRLTCDRTTSRS